jgi:uncharacterized repeat protein (TIGR03803 family)
LKRWICGFFATIVPLAACAGCASSPSVPSAAVVPKAALAPPQRYRVIFSFGGSDGKQPGALIGMDGTLYGTTALGGDKGKLCSADGCGTAFSITRAGAERVLHAFTGGRNGGNPNGLTKLDGVFYGTTATGGVSSGKCVVVPKSGCGTIFSITPSGMLHVLYRFQGGSDGAFPVGALTALNGVLYGVTDSGGSYGSGCSAGCGTVFSITTAGEENVIYRFGTAPDGTTPAGLTPLAGKLYGTTTNGGAGGLGTIFRVTTGGEENVLYSFTGSPDGAHPLAPLEELNGAFYGTTEEGGQGNGSAGFGTVFTVNAAGSESVLYRFQGADDADPQAPLTTLNGKLYGATPGQSGRAYGGTIFSVTTAGKHVILHTFDDKGEGYKPYGLIFIDGKFYGTTLTGGGGGDGAAFALTL